MSYRIQVYLDRLTCRDTESIHSSDKFAIAGVVATDTDTSGFAFPSFRINDHSPDDIHDFGSARIFDGTSAEPKVALSFRAWDLDENDSWVENEAAIQEVSASAAAAAQAIPGWGTAAGFTIEALSAAVSGVIDQFIKWDKDDLLVDYKGWQDAPTDHTNDRRSLSIEFKGDSPLNYSSWDYTLDLTIDCETLSEPFSFGTGNADLQDAPRQLFAYAAEHADKEGFNGAFPTFVTKSGSGLSTYSIYVLLRELEPLEKHMKPDTVLRRVSKRRTVPFDQMGNPPANDFRAMMRATSSHARQQGCVGGFPSAWNSAVCRCIFLYPEGAERRHVRCDALGNPDLDDVPALFVAVHEYAVKEGFVGGFPDYDDKASDLTISWPTCSVILINQRAGKLLEGVG